jgi:tetratricopeptide (TPR) repeat protein
MAAGFCFLAWGLSRRSGPAAAVAFLAALLCKESAVALPAWLLLVERPRRAHAWLIAGAAAYLALRAASFGFTAPAVSHDSNVLLGEPLGVRVLTALHLLGLALRLILAPVELSADYAFAALLPSRGVSLDVALGALGLVALVAAAWLARRRAPDVTRGVAIFLVGFATIANVGALLPALFAERLLYLPAAGIAVALAGALRHRRLGLALAALLVAGNLARSVVRDGDWRDDLALFSTAVETTPDSARAWFNLGSAQRRAGRLDDALASLARATAIAPDWAKPRTAAGAALDQLGRPELAEPQLRRALALDPDLDEAAYNYALFLARHGRAAEARALLEAHVARRPATASMTRLLDDLRSR